VEIVEGASNPVEEKKAPAKAKAEKPAAKTTKKAKAEDVAEADA
jgi:small subunit ribosomal protein S17